MDPAIVSAMAAVFGSLVGGSATVATAWVTQSTLTKRELLGAEIRTRQTLYGEFIRECSKLVVDSFTHTLNKPETLLPVYEVLNRIRLCASDAVLAEAERILATITEQYFSPNLSVDEIRALVRSGKADADPLRSFGEACRVELKSMRGAVQRFSGDKQHLTYAAALTYASLQTPPLKTKTGISGTRVVDVLFGEQRPRIY